MSHPDDSLRVSLAAIPATLHHYTTAPGLLGIISTSTLWATECRFLNDSTEFTYVYDLLDTELAALTNPANDPAHFAHASAAEYGDSFLELRDIIRRHMAAIEVGACVTCFCESGDLLSQWRGYATDHGYSVEFDCASLLESVTAVYGDGEPGIYQVQYGANAATAVVERCIDDVRQDGLMHPGTHGFMHAMRFLSRIVRVKHPGFAEEREWRAVVSSYRDVPPLKFRPTNVAVVPYYPIEFDLQSAVVSIHVGPGERSEVRRQGIDRLLGQRGLVVPVRISEVPLRS